MKLYISVNKPLTIYFLPVIFLIVMSFSGCDFHYSYSDEYYDNNGYDDGSYDDEPDYPDPPNDGGYDEPDNPAPSGSGGYDIILIGYWKISLIPSTKQETNNSLQKTSVNEVKYYEIEESYSPDFSVSNKTYKLHKNSFKPYTANSLIKYDRVRVVYANSKSEWSNAIIIQ